MKLSLQNKITELLREANRLGIPAYNVWEAIYLLADEIEKLKEEKGK